MQAVSVYTEKSMSRIRWSADGAGCTFVALRVIESSSHLMGPFIQIKNAQ